MIFQSAMFYKNGLNRSDAGVNEDLYLNLNP